MTSDEASTGTNDSFMGAIFIFNGTEPNRTSDRFHFGSSEKIFKKQTRRTKIDCVVVMKCGC